MILSLTDTLLSLWYFILYLWRTYWVQILNMCFMVTMKIHFSWMSLGKQKAQKSFRMSGSIHPVTQHLIPDTVTHRICDGLKSCTVTMDITADNTSYTTYIYIYYLSPYWISHASLQFLISYHLKPKRHGKVLHVNHVVIFQSKKYIFGIWYFISGSQIIFSNAALTWKAEFFTSANLILLY